MNGDRELLQVVEHCSVGFAPLYAVVAVTPVTSIDDGWSVVTLSGAYSQCNVGSIPADLLLGQPHCG